jgi:hypothetical protein
MPVSCSTSVLTGQDGALYFKPPGTEFCLLAADFGGGTPPVATRIAVPLGNDFAVGDPVTFVEEGGATLDGALTVGTVYFVRAGGSKSPFIEVSATVGGVAIPMLSDGDDAAGHIRVTFADFQSVCQVRNFSLEISREELDITTLPCAGDAGANAGKYVQFKRYQGGFGDGSGSMTVLFTEDQATVANRMLRSVLLRSQAGAAVQLFFNHVVDATGEADLDASSVLESAITLTSMSVSVNPESPQEASINYRLAGQPTRMFGIVL